MTMLKEKFNIYKTIRANSIVYPFGVGSMVDLPDSILMTASCDSWIHKDLKIIHDERLEKVLKVNCFKSFDIKEDETDDKKVYVPFVQFPTWMFCPKCRRFKPLKQWENEYQKVNNVQISMKKNVCVKCGVKLSPARIIVACENGHIDDFPWIEWTHYKNNKKICSNPELYIRTSGVSSGLEGIKIECKTCGAKANLSKALDNSGNVFKMLEDTSMKFGILDEKNVLTCTGNMPWEGRNEKCECYPIALQRGATNVYFPKIESSLLIPPYSEKINKKIEESASFVSLVSILEYYIEDKKTESEIKNTLETFYNKISEEIGVHKDIIKKIVDRKMSNNKGDDIEDKIKYKEEEYKVLTGEYGYEPFKQIDFKTEILEGSLFKRKFIENIVLIHKMKETRVLTGFSRINAPDLNIIESNKVDNKTKLVRPLRYRDWYPAIEVRGEGIFIQFNEEILDNWINSNEEIKYRSQEINNRYNKILLDKGHSLRIISPKFILLHTLSHLIIKEMSFKCGYSSTALRERIYCNSFEDRYKMAGILIYTANGDSEGTLGGLVRQGREDKLINIIDLAVEKARFCSSDPVCVESKGQGRDALNMAACYSCALISETSCEEFNTLLDRAMVVGTLDNPSIGFFNYTSD